MNVVLDNIIFSLQKTGGVSVVWQQHLERLIKDEEFQCRFLEFDNSKLNFFRQQFSISEDQIVIKNSNFLFLSRYLNLNIQNNQKHIFHSSYYRVEKATSAINVTTVHDFTYEYFVKGLSQKVHSWQKNVAIRNSEGIICVSESTKKDLLRFLPDVDKNKIRVIYNGVNETYRPLQQSLLFKKEHSFEDYSYALYVGDRKAGYKNFYMAADACAMAKIPFLIIGGGELTETELYYLTSKLGEGNYRSLLGVSVEDLNYYYNNAYCLLYPSFYEGFGIPIVESQRAGCPVIATNSASIPEVIGNTYLAINSPTATKIYEKIKELSFSNDLRKETIELGFEKSKVFNWQSTYNQTKEFYKELYKD